MLKENVSALMDGELEKSDETLAQLTTDAELQRTWASYHTVRSVLRNEERLLGEDFSVKMAALLESESIDAVNTQQEAANESHAVNAKKARFSHLKRWTAPLMQLGVAASVCLVAVLGVNFYNSSNSDAAVQAEQPQLQTVPFSSAIQQVSYNAPIQSAQVSDEQLEKREQRLNALLKNNDLRVRTNANGVTLDEHEKEASAAAQNRPLR